MLFAIPSFAQETPQAAGPLASDARAAPEQDLRVEQAREAFTLGAARARQGQWLDALAAFERSLQLRPHQVTLYNVGYCERALGHFTRARKAFRAALAQHAVPEAQLPADLAAEAHGYLAEIERRIVRATVVLAERSARLSIDGRPLELESTHGGRTLLVAGTRATGYAEAPPAATFELLLDPGHHVFVLSSTASRESLFERNFKAGSAPRLELPGPTPLRAWGDSSKKPSPAHGRKDYTWTAVAYGVGAAGLVTGTMFGIATLKKSATLHDDCRDKKACPESSQGDIDAGHRYAIISNVGFGVGLVGAGLGTWLLLSSKPMREQPPSKPRGSIRASAGFGNFSLAGSF